MGLPVPDADARIVFSRHAADRLREPDRGHTDDLARVRSEIRVAIRAGRVEHDWRNTWRVTADDGRRFVVACRGDRLVVVTVKPPLGAVDRSGPRLRAGYAAAA